MSCSGCGITNESTHLIYYTKCENCTKKEIDSWISLFPNDSINEKNATINALLNRLTRSEHILNANFNNSYISRNRLLNDTFGNVIKTALQMSIDGPIHNVVGPRSRMM